MPARPRGLAEKLPVPADILAIDKVPVLGSGKTNYVAATALAKERVGGDQKVA